MSATLFTGKCHNCDEPVARSLYCTQCAVIESIGLEIFLFTKGEEQKKAINHLGSYRGWPEIIDFVRAETQKDANLDFSALVALAYRIRGLVNGVFGKRLPTGDDKGSERRAIADECHRAPWKRGLCRAGEMLAATRAANEDEKAYLADFRSMFGAFLAKHPLNRTERHRQGI